MITRLEVDGFKSLRGFAVDLEPLTAFIGPNGAGKSNILEALALLSRLASEPIVDAFRHGRGRMADQFSRFGGEVAAEIRFAAEFLVGINEPPDRDLEGGRFRYELIIERVIRDSGTEHLFVRHEQLEGLQPKQDTWMAAHPEFTEFARYDEAGLRGFVATGDQELALKDARIDRRQTILAQHVRGDVSEAISDNLQVCQWIRLDLTHLAGSSERVDTGALRPDGSNLPTVLADLSPSLLGEVRADLVALVPGIASFVVVPEDDVFAIEFALSGGDRLPARLVSDGTLRLLALLTALRLEPRPYLIGIEEPENGIYPGRLRALVDLLRQEAERRPYADPGKLAGLEQRFSVINLLPTQVLLTTHSPVILAALRNHPQQLRFVDTAHRDGRRVTRARAVGEPTPASRHLVVSPREIDQLLDAATSEELG